MRKKLEPSSPRKDRPELSEDQRKEQLKHHTASLQRILDKQRTAKQGMFSSFAALIGDRDEKDRSRLIWKGLVRFANEDMGASTKGILGTFALRAALALCIYGHPELDEIKGEVFELEFFEDVYLRQKATKQSPENAFSVLALELQPTLRLLLAWIADPNRQSIEANQRALAFLIKNSESQPSPYEYRLNDKFDVDGSIGYPLYYWKNPRAFQSIGVPIARFIFERLELFHEGQIDLDEAVPVVLCRREGCGKFSVARRRTKDFCSDSCRSRHRQKEDAERHAAYMLEYRRNNYTKPIPRSKSGR